VNVLVVDAGRGGGLDVAVAGEEAEGKGFVNFIASAFLVGDAVEVALRGEGGLEGVEPGVVRADAVELGDLVDVR